jgi:DNA anti-recombination protein RmuC
VSRAQIKKLFGMVERLSEQVDAMKRIIERLANNSDAILGESVLAVIQQHGLAIEHATRVLEKLSVRCPHLRPETNEFPKVDGSDG